MIARWLFAAGQPKSAEDLEALFEHYREASDIILRKSLLLAGLDFASEAGGPEILRRISEQQYGLEFFALLRGSAASGCKDALEAGDARTAALMMYRCVLGHVMAVFKAEMEESMWRGYLASKIVHESAAASARTVAEAEAVKNLEPLFSRLDERYLHTLVNSGLPIGPRIGVKGLPEEILKPLAEWHLSQFDRRREDHRRHQELEMQQRSKIGNINISNSVLGTLNTGNIASLDLSMEAIRVSGSKELADTLKQFTEAVGNSDVDPGVKNDVLENLSFVSEQVNMPADQRRRGVVKAAIEKISATVSGMAALWGIWQKLEPLLRGVFEKH